MGSRSAGETLAAILSAFLRRRSWRQIELARHIGVSVRTLRKRLVDLSSQGIPFYDEAEHPHVVWTLPDGFLPGGVVIAPEDSLELLRLVARAPKSATRDRLFARLLAATTHSPSLDALPERVVALRERQEDPAHLSVLEDAIARQIPLHFDYYSATSGSLRPRLASVYQEVRGDAVRFIARCHEADALRWFRLDGVTAARLATDEPYRPCAFHEVAAFRQDSADGFHGGTAPKTYAVFVRDPECRWVARNTPCPMTQTSVPGGLRFVAHTAGVRPLARWVAGLGDAAHAETEELADLVQAIARGALHSHSR